MYLAPTHTFGVDAISIRVRFSGIGRLIKDYIDTSRIPASTLTAYRHAGFVEPVLDG